MKAWIPRLYPRGLNLSNRHIAREFGLDTADGQRMIGQLRGGVAAKEEELPPEAERGPADQRSTR